MIIIGSAIAVSIIVVIVIAGQSSINGDDIKAARRIVGVAVSRGCTRYRLGLRPDPAEI